MVRLSESQLLGLLSGREQQIAELICSGLSNKLIARQLDLSEGTVKQHVHHILLKLGTHNRYRLTVLLNGNNPIRDEGRILD